MSFVHIVYLVIGFYYAKIRQKTDISCTRGMHLIYLMAKWLFLAT